VELSGDDKKIKLLLYEAFIAFARIKHAQDPTYSSVSKIQENKLSVK
jgi:hypothetical protein